MNDWLGLVAGALLGVCSCGGGIAIGRGMSAVPESKLPIPVDLHARVSELEARVEAQAKLRCFNVTTGRLDVAVFPVENVGVVKIPEGRKP